MRYKHLFESFNQVSVRHIISREKVAAIDSSIENLFFNDWQLKLDNTNRNKMESIDNMPANIAVSNERFYFIDRNQRAFHFDVIWRKGHFQEGSIDIGYLRYYFVFKIYIRRLTVKNSATMYW